MKAILKNAICLLCIAVGAQAIGATVQDTMKALQSMQVEDMDTTVPPAARPLLTQLKKQLREEITDILNRNPLSLDRLHDSDRLTTYLHSELRKRGITISEAEDPDSKAGPYGNVIGATLDRPEGRQRLLIVTTTVGIMCGSDDSLYVFKRNGALWTLTLALEKNDYEEISSAQFGLQYAVSPPDNNEEFFVSIVHTTAWCTSNWQGLQYKTLRPALDPYFPKVILSGSEGVYLGVDNAYKVTASKDSLTLSFIDSSFDSGLLTRPYILKFKIEKDSARRIAPVALRAQDFLEEWMRSSWKEVTQWDHSSTLADAERWHAVLQSETKDASVSYDFVQKCGDRELWQIGLDFEPFSGDKTSTNPLPATLYFTIAKRDSLFYLVSIERRRVEGCPGEDPAAEWPEDATLP